MGGYVSEIFGFPPRNEGKEAQFFRRNFLCPFQKDSNGHSQCDPINKKSNLTDENGNFLVAHQTGTCSAYHRFRDYPDKIPIIICPFRFLERNENDKIKVFDYIKERFFARGNKNMFCVPEIGLGSYGRADWIIFETKTEKQKFEISDYALVEFQADATTNTRQLVLCVKDFFDGKDITKRNYNYGLNSKASIKGGSLQMIDKGYLFQKFDKKSIWVIQDTLFHNLCTIFGIEMEDCTKKAPPQEHTLIFIVLSLKYNKSISKYDLLISKCQSTSPSYLQRAISDKVPISEDFLLDALKRKFRSGIFLKV